MAKFGFNVAEVEAPAPRTYGPLPKGDYTMIITDSTVKTTKSGDGQYIELTMQVIDGEHQGRRHWERLNISNPNPQAEQIARAALAQLCQACNLPDAEDSEDLHNVEFIARMDIDRKDPERNRLLAYLPASNAKPVRAAAPVRPPAASAAKARPWA